MQFDGIVSLDGCAVRLIELHCGLAERRFHIAAFALLRCRFWSGRSFEQFACNLRSFASVAGLHPLGGGTRLFLRLGDDNGDILTVVTDHVVLERRSRLVDARSAAFRGRYAIKRADVVAVIDGDDARHFLRSCGVELRQRAVGDGGAYRPGMQQPFEMMVR